MIEHGVTDPFRTAPATRSRFFVTSTGKTFIDLDEVVYAVVCGDKARLWLRHQPDATPWTVDAPNVEAFMRALVAYRVGE
jgi:hypothetical protein